MFVETDHAVRSDHVVNADNLVAHVASNIVARGPDVRAAGALTAVAFGGGGLRLI
jgi:hypothetical protein